MMMRSACLVKKMFIMALLQISTSSKTFLFSVKSVSTLSHFHQSRRRVLLSTFTYHSPKLSVNTKNCSFCRFYFNRHGIKFRKYGACAPEVSELQSKDDTPSATYKQVLHTVMVHRNKQSLAFKDGTPLIFSGSVAATFSEVYGTEPRGNDIPIGSLVEVVVSRDSVMEDTKLSKSGGKKTRASSGKSSYPHYEFNSADIRGESFKDLIKKSQLIGYGVYNPLSMYRVRILCHESTHSGLTKRIHCLRRDIPFGDDTNDLIIRESKGHSCDEIALKYILERKIADAWRLRFAMKLPLPNVTDTYRLINGEGDGLSGLVVDIIGRSTAIVMSSSAWCEIHKETIRTILIQSLKQHPSYENVEMKFVWRNTPSRLAQDGYSVDASDILSEQKDGTAVVATESSVKYVTHPYSEGQKTGFYCDQRENRIMIAELCENKRVLDLCCYNGGFALNAMLRGNALSVIGVDSSQDAIDAANANLILNGLNGKKISFLRGDISTFMKNATESNDEYDVIVLDPPKLATSLSLLLKASRKYHSLNRDAINLVNKSRGGLLLTCTCSAAMSQKDGGQYFLNVVNGAALSAKRQITLLRVSGAAPCHTQSPSSFPAGNYLTCALFYVRPTDSIYSH